MLLTRQSAGLTDLMKRRLICDSIIAMANFIASPALHRPIIPFVSYSTSFGPQLISPKLLCADIRIRECCRWKCAQKVCGRAVAVGRKKFLLHFGGLSLVTFFNHLQHLFTTDRPDAEHSARLAIARSPSSLISEC